MSRISRQSSTTTIQIITKIMFIVSAEQVVLVQRELQSPFLQATVLDRLGNSLPSSVRPINTSILNSPKWLDIAAVEAVTRDTDTVVAVVVEVLHLSKMPC